MTPQDVEVYIEELVLHGFPPGDRYRIGDAVKLELERLLTENGLPAGVGHNVRIDRVDGGSIKLPPKHKAGAVGSGVAKAVYRGLGK